MRSVSSLPVIQYCPSGVHDTVLTHPVCPASVPDSSSLLKTFALPPKVLFTGSGLHTPAPSLATKRPACPRLCLSRSWTCTEEENRGSMARRCLALHSARLRERRSLSDMGPIKAERLPLDVPATEDSTGRLSDSGAGGGRLTLPFSAKEDLPRSLRPSMPPT